MNRKSFHHPDWSLPVIHRRASEEWIDVLCGVGETLMTRGKSIIWNQTYPNQNAYNNAMSRLRKKGLVVQSNPKDPLPRILLTKIAKQKRPDYYNPEKWWNSHWNKIWYTLIFDVPEVERHYRDTLRKFLIKLRMGCLQRSVWITPRDIRPEYDDLEKADAVNSVAYLLESQAVLHRDQQEMVQNAWDFKKLETLQARYIDIFTENLFLIPQAQGKEDLMDLLYEESEAYLQTMRNDPLLPRKLHPKTYRGRRSGSFTKRF